MFHKSGGAMAPLAPPSPPPMIKRIHLLPEVIGIWQDVWYNIEGSSAQV